jgi:hypothetical protein
VSFDGIGPLLKYDGPWGMVKFAELGGHLADLPGRAGFVDALAQAEKGARGRLCGYSARQATALGEAEEEPVIGLPSPPWWDSRLDAIQGDGLPVVAWQRCAVTALMDEALLYGVSSRWQALLDEGWSGWLPELESRVRLVPVRATRRLR